MGSTQPLVLTCHINQKAIVYSINGDVLVYDRKPYSAYEAAHMLGVSSQSWDVPSQSWDASRRVVELQYDHKSQLCFWAVCARVMLQVNHKMHLEHNIHIKGPTIVYAAGEIQTIRRRITVSQDSDIRTPVPIAAVKKLDGLHLTHHGWVA